MRKDTTKQRFGRVQLRATKGDTSQVVILSREAAALRCVELSAEGWSVEVTELAHQDVREGPGAWGSGAALRGRYAELLARTQQTLERAVELQRETVAALESSRLLRSQRYPAEKLS